VALDAVAVQTPDTPEWWMTTLAKQLLDRNRVVRLATLDAYRAGCPPLPYLAPSERKGFYHFHKVSRTNFARTIVRAPAQRMAIRSIRTSAAGDDDGDAVAWRYWTANGLDVASTDVHSDMLTFSEAYVRVGVDTDGQPIALRRDPRFCITAQDPLNPNRTIAAFELLWDEWAGRDYAYLWLPGEEWVADRERTSRPGMVSVTGVTGADARRFGWWWPRLTFDPTSFTMRPARPDDEAEADDGPYSQKFDSPVVPVVRFDNRDGVGEFEDHLDLLDRIHHTVMTRVVTAAVQAYKQRALTQDIPTSGQVVDRLPATNPTTNEPIDWASLFEPGPDALWKLPPGVKIWESTEVQLKPLLDAVTAEIKTLSAATDTPIPLLSDDTNQSAEGAQLRREGLVFKVEDCTRIAGRRWAQVMSLLFMFAAEADRYAPGPDGEQLDRSDPSQIIINWFPAERFSLAEKAQADSQNKSLSIDMAAEKIWQLDPSEVAKNREQRKSDAELPVQYRVSDLPFDPNAPVAPVPAAT
jgi:hypothetical protein